jgi:hypothetical protein
MVRAFGAGVRAVHEFGPTSQKRDVGHRHPANRIEKGRAKNEASGERGGCGSHPCAIQLRMNGAPRFVVVGTDGWATRLL